MKKTINCSKCDAAIEGTPTTESLDVILAEGGQRHESFPFHESCHASIAADGLKSELLKLLKLRYPDATIVLEKD